MLIATLSNKILLLETILAAYAVLGFAEQGLCSHMADVAEIEKPNLAKCPEEFQLQFQVATWAKPADIEGFMTSDKSNWDLIRWQLEEQNAKTTRIHCLDIGGNHGLYSMFMASLGCYVDYFEIQARMAALARYSVSLNNLNEKVHIHRAGISDEKSTFSIDESGDKLFGGLAFLDKPSETGVSVYPASECIRSSHFAVIKIDVEGLEVRVVRGLTPIIAKGGMEAAIIEIGPGRWSRANLTVPEGAAILRSSLEHYTPHVILRMDYNCPNHIYPKESPSDIPLSGGQILRQIPWPEMQGVFQHLADGQDDCNFWFSRRPMSELTLSASVKVY